MLNALAWPEVTDKENVARQEVDEQRDFITENRDQFRTFSVPGEHDLTTGDPNIDR